MMLPASVSCLKRQSWRGSWSPAWKQCVEDRPELEAIFNFYGGDYGSYFITSFLSHGIDDTYLLDAETGTINFDSSDFRKALELAGKWGNGNRSSGEPGGAISGRGREPLIILDAIDSGPDAETKELLWEVGNVFFFTKCIFICNVSRYVYKP